MYTCGMFKCSDAYCAYSNQIVKPPGQGNQGYGTCGETNKEKERK